MTAPIIRAHFHWHCPKCGAERITHESRPHTPLHPCGRLGGLEVPMVRMGTKAKVEVREREDYVGDEVVRIHDGRAVMSVVTEREDGTDVAVFAPVARGSGHG